MVATSCPGSGLQGHAQSHVPVFARIAQPASYGRPQLYTYGRPPTPVRQVVLNPALTPFQCGICHIFYTSEVDLLERHIEETHRRINRSTAGYAPTQVTQAQRQTLYVPSVPQLQLPPHGTVQPTYQHQWMPMMRYSVVRSSPGVTSVPAFAHTQGGQPSLGGVNSSTNRTTAQAPATAQPQNNMVMASVPVTAGEWFSSFQSFPGARSVCGTVRDSKESPGGKRRRSSTDLRHPIDFSGGGSKSGSHETRGELSEATEQQPEVMIFEPGDLPQEFAPAAVSLTYKNPISHRPQQQQMEQTASSTLAAATVTSLDSATQHSHDAELTETGSKQSDDTRATGKLHPKVTTTHYLSEEELPCGSLADDSCLSITEQASHANKETVPPHQNAAISEHERTTVTGATELATGCALTVASEGSDDSVRSLRGSELSSEIRQLGSDAVLATSEALTSQTNTDAEPSSKAAQMDKQKREMPLEQKTLESDNGES